MIDKYYPTTHQFVQDNDPKHTSARAQQFFTDHGINWWCTPPETPDCNPIGNLWHELKEHLRRYVRLKNKGELVQGIVAFWDQLPSKNAVNTSTIWQRLCPK